MRWNWMEWSNYMCFWVVLYLLQRLLFSMYSMYWKWSSFSQFNSSKHNFSNLHESSIHVHMHSSVDVPLDIDRPPGEPKVGVGLA